MRSTEEWIKAAAEGILEDYRGGRDIDRMDLCHHPDKETVADIVRLLYRVMFPGCCRDRETVCRYVEDVLCSVCGQVTAVLADEQQGIWLCREFFQRIPRVRANLQTDLQAAFDGDPAATGKDEVILSYPGLYAVTVYRLAHELHLLGLPMIPRMMTEYAHSVTGIDIHPGAAIGPYFFIDHGTGIVIGETAVIGESVKIYQGVTLGGLSTRGGQSLRGVRRHPTIGDNVTIYANATILGGDTVIGRDCVIGSSVFITESVAPGTTVTNQAQQLQYKIRNKE